MFLRCTLRLSNYGPVTAGYLAPAQTSVPTVQGMKLLLLGIRVAMREIVIESENRGRGAVLTSTQMYSKMHSFLH